MKKAILATKVGMTQIFNENGVLVPVTVLQAGPCVVTQIKTVENDGYSAVQVGFVDKKDRINNKDASGKKEVIHRHGANKAEQGHFKKAGVSSKRYVREFKFENAAEYALGRYLRGRRQGGCFRHLQGQGLPGCHQETGTAQRTHEAWFQVPSSPGFQRCMFLPQPCVQGQGYARSHGPCESDRPESGDRESGCGEESAAGKGRGSRTQEGVSNHQRDRQG